MLEDKPPYQGPADFKKRMMSLLEGERSKRGFGNMLVLLGWTRALMDEIEGAEKAKFFGEFTETDLEAEHRVKQEGL